MIALVTGAGRGIGRGIALGLANAGWSVGLTSRSQHELDETLKLANGRGIAVTADVTDPPQVRAMIQRIQSALGPIDLLVNNAGLGDPLGPFWETHPDDWWRNQEVNLRGPMLCCREIVPGMVARKSGRIVNIVSGAGCRPFPDLGAYVVSKTALIRFSEQLAMELAPHGVSVFPLHPGTVHTKMADQASARLPYIQAIFDRGLNVTPDAAANIILKLASGAADSLSGRFFSVTDDFDEIVRRSDEVRASDLYALRSRGL
jgi:NAD(P)-dependent dehydrogenase (short-subunit alcohol dehydrogenase family)